MLYFKVLNAVYVIMKASLLFYKNFVANKLFNDNQMTVACHVDDIKVSHDSKKIFTIISKWLKNTYERIFEDGSGKKKISRSKIHEYLSMTLNFY